MKNMDLASVLTAKRREKGITQDELAAHVGVSKGSVSKWENGNSYPDITLLPVIAAYFDISIDSLMNHRPQMSEADISKLYARLAEAFTTRPFEEVLAECDALVKKYFSCYILLVRMATLYLNHAPLAGSPERTQHVYNEAIRFCKRVASDCKDREIVTGSANLQAMCHLVMGDGEAVLALLGESLIYHSPDIKLVAHAHKLLGNEEKAVETMQICLYWQLMEMFDTMMPMLQENIGDISRALPIFRRAQAMADIFNMKHLNANNSAILYILGAQMYMSADMPVEALQALEKYADICINHFFPLTIRADGFFDKIDAVLTENLAPIPRSDAAVKADIVQTLHNPIFEKLQGNQAFQSIIKRLEAFAAK